MAEIKRWKLGVDIDTILHADDAKKGLNELEKDREVKITAKLTADQAKKELTNIRKGIKKVGEELDKAYSANDSSAIEDLEHELKVLKRRRDYLNQIVQEQKQAAQAQIESAQALEAVEKDKQKVVKDTAKIQEKANKDAIDGAKDQAKAVEGIAKAQEKASKAAIDAKKKEMAAVKELINETKGSITLHVDDRTDLKRILADAKKVEDVLSQVEEHCRAAVEEVKSMDLTKDSFYGRNLNGKRQFQNAIREAWNTGEKNKAAKLFEQYKIKFPDGKFNPDQAFGASWTNSFEARLDDVDKFFAGLRERRAELADELELFDAASPLRYARKDLERQHRRTYILSGEAKDHDEAEQKRQEYLNLQLDVIEDTAQSAQHASEVVVEGTKAEITEAKKLLQIRKEIADLHSENMAKRNQLRVATGLDQFDSKQIKEIAKTNDEVAQLYNDYLDNTQKLADKNSEKSALINALSKNEIFDEQEALNKEYDLIGKELDQLEGKYYNIIFAVRQWIQLQQKMEPMFADGDAAAIRKNVIKALQGVSPEIAAVIGEGFEQGLANGFKGVKTKDIHSMLNRVINSNIMGGVSNGLNMFEELDLKDFDLAYFTEEYKTGFTPFEQIVDVLGQIQTKREQQLAITQEESDLQWRLFNVMGKETELRNSQVTDEDLKRIEAENKARAERVALMQKERKEAQAKLDIKTATNEQLYNGLDNTINSVDISKWNEGESYDDQWIRSIDIMTELASRTENFGEALKVVRSILQRFSGNEFAAATADNAITDLAESFSIITSETRIFDKFQKLKENFIAAKPDSEYNLSKFIAEEVLGNDKILGQKLTDLQAQSKTLEGIIDGYNAQLARREEFLHNSGFFEKNPRVDLEDEPIYASILAERNRVGEIYNEVGRQIDMQIGATVEFIPVRGEDPAQKFKTQVLNEIGEPVKIPAVIDFDVTKDSDSSVPSVDPVKEIENAYEVARQKVNEVSNELAEANTEFEKLQKNAELYGYTGNGFLGTGADRKYLLGKDNRAQYVVDMLRSGHSPIERTTKGGKVTGWGFDRKDLGENVYDVITKTEYKYAKYLQGAIGELNVGWDEGLKILASQNGQLEVARNNVSRLESELDKVNRTAEEAYERMSYAHSGIFGDEAIAAHKQKLAERSKTSVPKENLGYHAGDLGRTDTYGMMGGRSTGHFGTGTYFVGNPKQIEGYNSRDGIPAPVEIIDFSKYNLFKPETTDEAYELHRTLQMINDELINMHKYDDLDLDALKQSIEDGDESGISSFIDKYLNENQKYKYENSANDYLYNLKNQDEDSIRKSIEASHKSIADFFFTDIEDEVDAILVEEVEIEMEIANRLAEVRAELENFNLQDRIATEVRYDIEDGKFDNLYESKKLKDNLVDKISEIFINRTRNEISNALDETFKTITGYDSKDVYKLDSASTVFMKQLGYEGIDTRHTSLDNISYGSVIYDLKGQDLERRQALVQKQEEAKIAAAQDRLAIEEKITEEKKKQNRETQSGTDLLDAMMNTIEEDNKKAKETADAFAEARRGKGKGTPYSRDVYHGSSVPLDNVTYDPSKGANIFRNSLGSGLYVTPDLELAAKYGENIAKKTTALKNVFVLTEDYVTNIDDLYAAMGSKAPDNATWENVKTALNVFLSSKTNLEDFARRMQIMGYDGVYSKGYGFVNDDGTPDNNAEQLAIYDEQHWKNLTTAPYAELTQQSQEQAQAEEHAAQAAEATVETKKEELAVEQQITSEKKEQNQLESKSKKKSKQDGPIPEDIVEKDMADAIAMLNNAKHMETAIANYKEVSDVKGLENELRRTAQEILGADLTTGSTVVEGSIAKVHLFNEALGITVDQTVRLQKASEDAKEAVLELISTKAKQDPVAAKKYLEAQQKVIDQSTKWANDQIKQLETQERAYKESSKKIAGNTQLMNFDETSMKKDATKTIDGLASHIRDRIKSSIGTAISDETKNEILRDLSILDNEIKVQQLRQYASTTMSPTEVKAARQEFVNTLDTMEARAKKNNIFDQMSDSFDDLRARLTDSDIEDYVGDNATVGKFVDDVRVLRSRMDALKAEGDQYKDILSLQDKLYNAKKKHATLNITNGPDNSETMQAQRTVEELQKQYDTSVKLLSNQEKAAAIAQRKLALDKELSAVITEQNAKQAAARAAKDGKIEVKNAESIDALESKMRNAEIHIENMITDLDKLGNVNGIGKATEAIEGMVTATREFREATTLADKTAAYDKYSIANQDYKDFYQYAKRESKEAQQSIEAVTKAGQRLEFLENEMHNVNTDLDTMAIKLTKLGDVPGVEKALDTLYKMEDAVDAFNSAQTIGEKEAAYADYKNYYKQFTAEMNNLNAAQQQQNATQKQSENTLKSYYRTLSNTINQISSLDSKLNTLKAKDGGSGTFLPLIDSLEQQRKELLAKISNLTRDMRTALQGGSVQGYKVELPFSNILNNLPEADATAIKDFFNDVRVQAALTEKEIDSLAFSLQKSQNGLEEFGIKLVDKVGDVRNAAQTFSKLKQGGIVSEDNVYYQTAASKMQNFFAYKNSLDPDATKWTGEQTLMFQKLANDAIEYIGVLDKAGQKEAQYFANHKKYITAADTHSSFTKIGGGPDDPDGPDEFLSTKDQLIGAANDIAKEFNASGAIVTDFVETADGISRLDFSFFDEGTKSLRQFSIAKGLLSDDMHLIDNSVDQTAKKIQAANQQVKKMDGLLSTLQGTGFKIEGDEAHSSVQRLLRLTQELSNAIHSDKPEFIEKITQEAKIATAEVQKLYNESMKTKNAMEDRSAVKLDDYVETDKMTDFDQLNDAVRKYAATQKDATLEVGKFNKEHGVLNYTMTDGVGNVTHYSASIDKLSKNINAHHKGVTKLQSGWKHFSSIVSHSAKQMLMAFSGYDVFTRVIHTVRQGITYIKDIDSAMTELKKVTDETANSYARFLDGAANTGSQIGATVSDFVNATADFARLGYTMDEAGKMAEAAIVYKNVADGLDTIEASTESITSTMKAFGVESSDTMSIIDSFNEVGNNFAITSAGIGEALKRSASALYEGGNTMEESIGLITGANTVVQDPEVVGTALKTLSLRIRGVKTELQEAGLETEGMAETTATLQKKLLALTHGKVNIMINEDEFKSTYDILEDMSRVWKDMTDVEQAAALELIGGKRQANILASLISNFETAKDAMETAANSEGSALKENAVWLDSIEGKTQQVTNSLQNMWNNALTSEGIKFFLDVGNSIIQAVDNIGMFRTALMGILGLLAATRKNDFGNFLGFNKERFENVASTQGFFAGMKEATFASNKGGVLDLLFSKKGRGTIKDAAKEIVSYGGALKTVAKEIGVADTATKMLSGTLKATTAASATSAAADLKKAATTTAVGVASRIAAVGVQLFNAALTMGISFLATEAIQVISEVIKTKQDLAEQVAEVTSTYKEQHQALMDNKAAFDESDPDSLISKYAELSKGVSESGENISLTTDEYAEYQDIVNSIADKIPSLVAGYDAQGNAILSCAGNVDKLTEAYQRLIHEQNQSIITNAGNIEKDFANTLKEAENGKWYKSIFGFGDGTTTSSIEILEEILNGDFSQEEIKERLSNVGTATMDGIYEALNDAGIGDMGWSWNTDEISETLADALEDDPQKIQGIITSYFATFNEAVDQQKTIAQAKLSEAFDVDSAISGIDYSNISENLQTVARGVVSSFDYDFLSKLSEDGQTVESWVTNMLDELNAISDVDSVDFDAAFDLRTKFNDDEISYGQYVGQLSDVSKMIDSLDVSDEVKTQMKLTLNTEDVINEYNNLQKKLTSEKYDIRLDPEEAKAFLDSLTAEELEVFANIIPELSNNDVYETVDGLRQAIEKAMAMEPVTVDIAVETENLENLSTAITESLSGTGLSSDAIKVVEGMFGNLAGYDASKLFERTANGIRLNSTELSRLNDEYANTNMNALNDKMSSLGDLYNETREELYELTYGTEEYNDKAKELSAIEAQINEVETLTAQYEGLTSAYNQWQMAESAGNQRDMYDSVLTGLETMEDELSRGWVDDSTVEFLELLSGKDLSTAGIKEIKKAYDGLDTTIKHTNYSVRDFFTKNKDGESTSRGVRNFLDAVGQMEEEKFGGIDVVQRDKKGNIIGFNFELVGGDEVIAEALGVSEELVQIMVRAADDAGFVISMDGSFQQLDVLKEKAQEASVVLNETLKENGGEGYDFNFNVSTIEEIKPQLKEAKNILDGFRNADGTINTEIKGANEALTVASTLQSMLDKLNRPTYMELETNQVEKDLQTPLEKLQEYQRLVETQHQLKLSGADTSKLKESKKEILDYFEGLDPEVKASIGLVNEDGTPFTREQIKEKIEKGELTIDATVDIQMEMDEKLGILVDKALKDAGLITDEEFNKRVEVYLDADVKTKDAQDKVEKATKDLSEDSSTSDDSSTGDDKDKTSGKNKNIRALKKQLKAAEKELDKIKTEKMNSTSAAPKNDNAPKRNYAQEQADKEKEITQLRIQIDTEAIEKIEALTDDDEKKQVVIDAVTKYDKGGTLDTLLADLDAIDDKKIKTEVIATLAKEGRFDEFLSSLDKNDKKIVIKAITEGAGDAEKLKEILAGIENEEVRAEVQALVEGALGDLGQVQSELGILDDTTATPEAEVEDNATSAINSIMGKLLGLDQSEANPDANLEDNASTKITSIVGQITSLGLMSANPSVSVAVTGLQLLEKAKKLIDKLKGDDDVNGTVHVNGTAHAKGTAWAGGIAHKGGSWGAKKTETALVGELGPEIVVRGSRWFTVGDQGAEFADIKKGDIIFNHKQTEELLSNGYVTSRGKMKGGAFAQGTAYNSMGEGAFWETVTDSGNNYKVKKKGTIKTSATNAAKDTKDAFEELFDWFEVKMEELNEDLDLFAAKLENAATLKAKNNIIDDMIATNKQELTALEKGYKLYSSYADTLLKQKNKKGNYIIPKKYWDEVKDGKVALEEFYGKVDEKTLEQIKNYREWAQKAADLKKESQEITKTLSELAKQKFDNISELYDNIETLQDNRQQHYVDMADYRDAEGWVGSTKYYEEAKREEKNKRASNIKERDRLQASLDASVKAGDIKKYSSEWYEMVNAIHEVDAAIAENKANIEEYQNQINEVKFDNFEKKLFRVSRIADETQNLIDALSDKDDFEVGADGDVAWTDAGLTKMGLYAQNIENAKKQNELYAEAIDDLNTMYNNGEMSYDEYIEKLAEYKDGQYDAIEAVQDNKDAIVEMQKARVDEIKKGIDKQIEAETELIEKQKEELSAKKDLYDFEKSVAEQDKSVADIKRQIAALSGDNSASARAKRKKLEAELAQAEQDLKDSYYDRSVEKQQEALDIELEQYTEGKEKEKEELDKWLENVDAVFADAVAAVESSGTAIQNTIAAVAGEWDLQINDHIKQPWSDASTALESTATALDGVIQKFEEAAAKADATAQAQIDGRKEDNADITDEVKDQFTKGQKVYAKKGTVAYNAKGKKDFTVGYDSNYTVLSVDNETGLTKVKNADGKIRYFKTSDLKEGAKPAGSGNSGSVKYYKKYTGDSNSISTALQAIGADGSYANREKIAEANDIKNYKGTADQNTQLLKLLKKGKLKKYAKGSKGINKDQLAWLDELGEELQLVPNGNGRLDYVKKGTGILTADMTERLMNLAMNPQDMIDRNRPSIGMSPNITNNEVTITMDIAEVVHIDTVTSDTVPDVTKAVEKQLDKYMKNLNSALRKHTR